MESWRALQLDIQVRFERNYQSRVANFSQREQVNTIVEALQCISNPQPVTVTSPTRPGVSVDAQQQVLIESLPPILVLHLKRFLYDTQVGDVVKVGKPISFTPELEIDSSMPQRSGFPFIFTHTDSCRFDLPEPQDSTESQV